MKINAVGSDIKVEDLERTEAWALGSTSERASQNSGVHKLEPTDPEGQIASTNAQRSPDPDHSKITLRLKKRTELIDRRKVIMSLLISNEAIFKVIFRLLRKQQVAYVVLILWMICNINFLAISFHNPIVRGWVCILIQTVCSISFGVHFTAFHRVDIIKHLAKSFNFWFSLANIIVFVSCFISLWGNSIEVLCAALHLLTGMVIMTFYDAHTTKDHALIKASSSIALASIMPLGIILLFRIREFNIETIYSDAYGIEVVNVRLQALDSLTTVIMYLLRIFYNQVIAKNSDAVSFLSDYYAIEPRMKPKCMNGQQKKLNPEKRSKNIPRVHDSTDAKFSSVVSGNACGSNETRQGDSSSASIGLFKKLTDTSERHKVSTEINHLVRNQEEEEDMQSKKSGQKDPEKHLIMGIMDNKFIEYSLHQTIFHEVILKKCPIAAKIVRSKFYHIFGLSVIMASSVLSFLICSGFRLSEAFRASGCGIALLGIFIVTFQIITTSNIKIVRYMTSSFDFWYFFFLLTKILVSSGFLCRWDYRMIFCVFSVLLLYWYILIDAYHLRLRKLSYFSIMGIIWTFYTAVICKLNIGDMFAQDPCIVFKGRQILSPRINLSTSMFSVCLFLIRFVWSYRKNPSRMLFITENITVKHLDSSS